jgi:hypothetical protein
MRMDRAAAKDFVNEVIHRRAGQKGFKGLAVEHLFGELTRWGRLVRGPRNPDPRLQGNVRVATV